MVEQIMVYTKFVKVPLLHFIVPISIGALIYILFRPTSILIFHWMELLGIDYLILKTRSYFVVGNHLPGWVIYSLPNGLWAYSFMFYISFIWGNKQALGKTFFITLVVILSVGSELGQLLGFVPGTFCLADIILYVLGLSVGFRLGTSYSGSNVISHIKI